jgi:cell division protein FtsZ
MGIGSSRGDDRAVQAAELAISSPLLEASIDGAHGVLLSIQGGSDLGLFEINEAARLVQEAAHPEANIIFGAVIDDALGDEVRVTVIAAGFDGGAPLRRDNDRAIGQIQGSQRPSAPAAAQTQPQAHTPAAAPAAPAPAQTAERGEPVLVHAAAPHRAETTVSVQAREASPAETAAMRDPAGRPPRTVTFDENDDLDVPDFLK